MASEPKKKHAKAYKRTRRAAISLSAQKLNQCPNCLAKILPHQACRECGFYAGKQVASSPSKVQITKA